MKLNLFPVLSAAVLTLSASAAFADDTWQGTTSTWTTAANWSGGVPTNAEGVNLVFYVPTITTVFTASTTTASRVAGNVEFLGSDASSFTISLGDGSSSTRSLRLYTGTATSGGNITIDSGASGVFSLIAGDNAGTRQLIWGPSGNQTAPVENHSVLNNSTNATLVIGVEQNENSATGATALNLTYGGAGNINVTAAINVSSPTFRTLNLIKQDAGTLTLSSTNGYNGSTTISGGVLQLGNGGITGSLDSTTSITDNAILAVNRSDAPVISLGIAGSGGLTQLGSGTTILTGANTFTGTTTISAGAVQIGNAGSTGSIAGDVLVQSGGALLFARTGTISYGGAIFGSGLVQKSNSGTLILTGASTFSGTTLILGTVNNNIRLANANALQNSTVSVSVTNGLRFETTSSSYTIGALSGNSTFALQDVAGSAVTLQAGGNNNSTTYSGTMSGNGNLVVVGTGTLTLTGSNTYTGNTTVNAGTLLLNGAGQIGGGNVAVNGTLDIHGITNSTYALGATQALGGTGTIAATGKTLSIAGALNPGNVSGVGTLNVTGGLSILFSATTSFNISGTAAGQFGRIVDNGLLTLGGSLSLATSYSASLGDTVDLFDWTTISGTFSSITGTSLSGGLVWDTTNLYTNGSITAVSAVPEPGTVKMALLAAGIVAAAGLRRRLKPARRASA